jgi:hypothetical protein
MSITDEFVSCLLPVAVLAAFAFFTILFLAYLAEMFNVDFGGE